MKKKKQKRKAREHRKKKRNREKKKHIKKAVDLRLNQKMDVDHRCNPYKKTKLVFCRFWRYVDYNFKHSKNM